ncbi:MAG: hypothetical protein PHT07_08400 [Paludibacter sp.]|nr:hypothetical protein [Paludibacter sp.]
MKFILLPHGCGLGGIVDGDIINYSSAIDWGRGKGLLEMTSV